MWLRQTAREYLEFEGRFWCIPKEIVRQRVPEVLKFLDLEDWAEEYPIKFSTGMKRKLQLGRALLKETPIMLFDEPTANIDPQSSWAIRDHIKKRAKRKGSRSFSPHSTCRRQNTAVTGLRSSTTVA